MIVSLNVTPLRHANIPPPMSSMTLPSKRTITDVALSKSGNSLAVLSTSDLAVYAVDLTCRSPPPPMKIWHYEHFEGNLPRQVAFLDEFKLFVLADSFEESSNSLWEANIELQPENMVTHILPQGSPICALVPGVQHDSLHLQTSSGHLLSISNLISTNGPISNTTSDLHFPTQAAESAVVTYQDQVRLHISLSNDSY